MRDFFTGTLASSIVDIPFIFIFIVAIAIWGGHLVWVPVSLIAMYAMFAAITLPMTRNYVREISSAKQRRHLLLQELFSKRSAIRALNAEEIWIARHRYLSGRFLASATASADSITSSSIWVRRWSVSPASLRSESAPFTSVTVR